MTRKAELKQNRRRARKRQRRFYKTVLRVEVLHEEVQPWEDLSLTEIDYLINDGDCSGAVDVVKCDELDGRQAAKALLKQGSDPAFFGLDEDGNDVGYG